MYQSTYFEDGDTLTAAALNNLVDGIDESVKTSDSESAYEKVDVITVGYSLLTEEPDDWSTNFEDYYYVSSWSLVAGNVYSPVVGSEPPVWEENKYYSYSSSGETSIEISKNREFMDISYKGVGLEFAFPDSTSIGSIKIDYKNAGNSIGASDIYSPISAGVSVGATTVCMIFHQMWHVIFGGSFERVSTSHKISFLTINDTIRQIDISAVSGVIPTGTKISIYAVKEWPV